MLADATTLLGTNRKADSEEAKPTNNNAPKKFSQGDFEVNYVSKIAPEKENDVRRKYAAKNKMVDLANDQYEVVDTSYAFVQLKQK